MFFIEPTLEEVTIALREKLANGEVSAEEIKAVFSADVSFLDDIEAMSLSDALKGNFTANVEPAYLGAERIKVDSYTFQVTAIFKKDGYTFFSDGTSAISMRRIFETLKEAAAEAL